MLDLKRTNDGHVSRKVSKYQSFAICNEKRDRAKERRREMPLTADQFNSVDGIQYSSRTTKNGIANNYPFCDYRSGQDSF